MVEKSQTEKERMKERKTGSWTVLASGYWIGLLDFPLITNTRKIETNSTILLHTFTKFLFSSVIVVQFYFFDR